MKLENEITVLVNCSYDDLHKQLLSCGFKLKEKYQLNDIYMIDSNINIKNYSNLDLLKKCILVRDIVDINKLLVYKYKKYAENGDIIEQGKVECPITDVDKAVKFMESINYKELFRIFDLCIVYANLDVELTVQLVNDEYIFIEMEQTGEYITKIYKDTLEMINALEKLNIDYNRSNYFVKKAELMLERVR